MAQSPVDVSEGELMRVCAPLYPSIATESLSSLLLFFLFAYIVLLVKTQTRLNTPGKAVIKLVSTAIYVAVDEWFSTLRTWSEMPTRPLKDRFRFCRKMNEMICALSAFIALISITRWLHIGNVNGFRYLGYAITCPIMQAEMVILIAPVVPFFRFNTVMAATITCVSLLAGYAASTMSGPIYEGSLEDLSLGNVLVGDFTELIPTAKFWWTMGSMLGVAFLIVVQMPWLCLLYTCRGGVSGGLPWGFRRLLTLVAVTWVGFPGWWLISFEGMNIVTDTKLNGLGFALLNVLSKGSFAWQVLLMATWHRRQDREKANTAAAADKELSQMQRQCSPSSSCSMDSTSSCDSKSGFFSLFQRRQSFSSEEASGCKTAGTSGHKAVDCEEDPWYVKLLLPYDSFGANSQHASEQVSSKPGAQSFLAFSHAVDAKALDLQSAGSIFPPDKHYTDFLTRCGISPQRFELMSVEEMVRIRILYDTMPLPSTDLSASLHAFDDVNRAADVTGPLLKSPSVELLMSPPSEKQQHAHVPLPKQPRMLSANSTMSTACPSSMSDDEQCSW